MNWKNASHISAVVIGMVYGLHSLNHGFRDWFIMGDYTWGEYFTVMAMELTLLPVSFLGIALPRVAGFCLLFSAAFAAAGSMVLGVRWEPAPGIFLYGFSGMIIMVTPLLLVAALFILSNKNWLPKPRRSTSKPQSK